MKGEIIYFEKNNAYKSSIASEKYPKCYILNLIF